MLGAVLWATIMLMTAVYINDRTNEVPTIIFYAGVIPFSALCVGITRTLRFASDRRHTEPH